MRLPSQIQILGDIPLDVRAQLPCRSLTVQDLLALEPGSVVKTDRAAGDSVDVQVAEKFICQGELLVIENSLGLRLSDFREKL